MASIGDFFIKVGWNSTELDKGITSSQKKLQNFGKQANQSLGSISNGLINMAKAYLSFRAIKSLTFDTARETENLANQAELVGAKAGDIQALGNALERFGGNTQEAVSAMKSLNNATQQARRGQGAFITLARRFGIWVKPAQQGTDALLSIGKQLGNLSRQQRIMVAKQLGLGDSLVRAFADGGKALSEYIEKQKELGTITEEDVKISKQFNGAWLDLKDNFDSLTRRIARYLMPVFTKLFNIADKFITYLKKHKMVLVGIFAALFVAMIPVLTTLTSMVAEALILAAPFIAIGAAVAAVGLIFEDLYYYFMGWDSATGELIKKFPGLAIVIEPLKPLVLGIADVFRKILNWLKEPTWENFVAILKSAGDVVLNALQAPFSVMSAILDAIMEKVPMLKPLIMPFKVVVDAIKDAFQWIKDIIDSISIDGIVNTFKSVKNTIGGWFGGDDETEQNDGEIKSLGDAFKHSWNVAKQKTEATRQAAQAVAMEEALALMPPPKIETKVDNINVETPEIPALASNTYTNNYNQGGAYTNYNTFNVSQNISSAIDGVKLGKDIGLGLTQQVNAQYQQRGRL